MHTSNLLRWKTGWVTPRHVVATTFCKKEIYAEQIVWNKTSRGTPQFTVFAMTVLLWLVCSDYSALTGLLWLFCYDCFALTVLLWLFCYDCFAMTVFALTVLLRLVCSDDCFALTHFTAVEFLQLFHGFHVFCLSLSTVRFYGFMDSLLTTNTNKIHVILQTQKTNITLQT